MRSRFLLLALGSLVAAGPLAACRPAITATGARKPAAPDARGNRPAAAFFRAPVLSDLQLSPDGRQLAGIATRDGVQVLVVRPTRGGAVRFLAKLDEPGLSIARLGWANDENLLVSVEMPSQAAVGVRARQTRLLVVPVDGAAPRYLGRDWRYQEYSQFQDRIIDWLWDDPDHVLINYWQPDQNGASARLLNVKTGALSTVVPSVPSVTTWVADHRGQVRAGFGRPRSGTGYFLYARADPEGDFEKVIDYDPFAEKGFVFAGFSENPGRIYVFASAETGREAVYSYDLFEKRLGPMVFGHPEVDVDSLVSSPRDGRLLAIEYVTDRPQLRFFDERARREQAVLDHEFPDTTNRIVSRSRDGRTAIAMVSGDAAPPRYYLYEPARERIELLVEAYPELDPGLLSPMKPVSFRARDGLEIPGYLTLPKDAPPTRLPAIVYVHGGPWARDVWGYDPTVQFLASRGFAVFQPNYRGSSGYGARFLRLGYQQWGLAMQDDVTDGVQWLIEQGIADPERIGIYGASYGGYAALMALVKTPELFAAGASLAGVTDLITLLDDDAWYGFEDWNRPMVGGSWKDRTRLEETSPARNADRIRAPVLIAHGVGDWRVHVRQAERMAEALEDRKKSVETHIYRDEVHGFNDERNAIDFHEKLAAFFARHLPPAGPVASGAPGDARSARGPD